MGLWLIFSLSFVVALSGALVPGPLLTYTIVRTMQSKKGYLIGLWVIAGHALLESLLIIAILLGFAVVLNNPLTTRIIGTAGAAFLLYMGVSIIIDVIRGKVVDPLQTKQEDVRLRNPVLGGFLISMSNPYWWIWWASIGFAFMLQYKISLSNWPALAAFLAGHEAGDLIWYLAVSILVSLGRNHISPQVYRVILLICGIFIAGFGLYLGISPYLGSA